MVITHRVGHADRVGGGNNDRDLGGQKVQRRGVFPQHRNLWPSGDAECAGGRLLHTRYGGVGWGRCRDGAGAVHAPCGVESTYRVAGPVNQAISADEYAVVQAVAGWQRARCIDLARIVEPADLYLGGVFNVEVQAVGGSGAAGRVELYSDGTSRPTASHKT